MNPLFTSIIAAHFPGLPQYQKPMAEVVEHVQDNGDELFMRVCMACGWKFLPRGQEHCCNDCINLFAQEGTL